MNVGTARIAILAHGIISPTVTGLQSMQPGFLLRNKCPHDTATERAPTQVVSEHNGASQVATEHNVTNQGTSDVNDTESDDGPDRPCAMCTIELDDDLFERKCGDCKRESCFGCMERCYQQGCLRWLCSPCMREHDMHCRGRGDLTSQLCWPSGHCIQRFENIADIPIPRLLQDMDVGLIQGLPGARTTSEGEYLEYYSLVYGINVMSGGSLSDYNLEPDARLTVVCVDLSDALETWRSS